MNLLGQGAERAGEILSHKSCGVALISCSQPARVTERTKVFQRRLRHHPGTDQKNARGSAAHFRRGTEPNLHGLASERATMHVQSRARPDLHACVQGSREQTAEQRARQPRRLGPAKRRAHLAVDVDLADDRRLEP